MANSVWRKGKEPRDEDSFLIGNESVSVQTLINWSKDKKILFAVVIKGAVSVKSLK